MLLITVAYTFQLMMAHHVTHNKQVGVLLITVVFG
jgi:hypothetical protein